VFVYFSLYEQLQLKRNPILLPHKDVQSWGSNKDFPLYCKLVKFELAFIL